GSDFASPNMVSSMFIALPRQTTLAPVQPRAHRKGRRRSRMTQANGIRQESGQPAAKARSASEPYQKTAATATARAALTPRTGAARPAAAKVKRLVVRISGAKQSGNVARLSRAQRSCRDQTS